MDKEIYYEVITALEKLNEVYDHIDNAMNMAKAGSFLQDTLHVAQRNIATTHIKLEVASDLTKTL
jgi:hypothetical protein